MGYTTRFSGTLTIAPTPPAETMHKISEFCNKPPFEAREIVGSPCCDWETTGADGLKWNGSEKSYGMFEWLKEIVWRFLPGHVLDGRVIAQGEEVEDRWFIVPNPEDVQKRDEEGRCTASFEYPRRPMPPPPAPPVNTFPSVDVLVRPGWSGEDPFVAVAHFGMSSWVGRGNTNREAIGDLLLSNHAAMAAQAGVKIEFFFQP